MTQKRWLAFSILSGFAGVAWSQQSITLFGTLDVNVRALKTDGQPRYLSENSSGLNASAWGLRGQEDLGGGNYAGFILVSDIGIDTGSGGDTTRNKFYQKQSIVRMWGKWGEIRLGRDYTPTYLVQGVYDVFGNLGLGNVLNARQMYNGTRIDNSIGYVLPPGLGGVFGDVKIAAGERGTTFDRPGRYIGARVGWSGAPVDVMIAVGKQRFDVAWPGAGTAVGTGASTLSNGALVPAAAGSSQTTYNIGASYDLGVVKLIGLYDREELQDKRENLYSLGAVVPIGLGEVHVDYVRSTLHNPAATVVSATIIQTAIGYVYNFSKRTALYTTASRLNNKDATTVTLPGSGKSTPGGMSQGVEFGIRHFF